MLEIFTFWDIFCVKALYSAKKAKNSLTEKLYT